MQLCSMEMCACAAAARVFKIIVGHLSYLFCAMASSNGQVSQQCLDLGVRDSREVCKKLGIACRGNREEILSRLSAFPPGAIRAAWGFGRRSAEKHQGKTPAKEESIDQLRQHVLPDGNKRRRVEPERYSPNTSVEDDDGSNWDGISLDSSSVKSTVKEVETISDGE